MTEKNHVYQNNSRQQNRPVLGNQLALLQAVHHHEIQYESNDNRVHQHCQSALHCIFYDVI